MKIKKFLLLSAAMMLSAAVSAQEEPQEDYTKYGLNDGIDHRYPAFKFSATLSVSGQTETLTFIMPAWDAYVSSESPAGTGKGYRMAALIPKPSSTSTVVPARIVAPRAFSLENTAGTGSRWFASFTQSTAITVYKPGGETLETTTADVTYGDIFGSNTHEPNAKPFTFTKTTSQNYDLTIQETRKIQGGIWLNYTFKIVEIGEAAFRNQDVASSNVSSITGTVTIRSSIEKIENNAFRNGHFKKVVFADDSPITTIEAATFEGCENLEEVVLPASLTKIEGTAFGDCKNLKKMVFKGNLPELTLVDEEPNFNVSSTKIIQKRVS